MRLSRYAPVNICACHVSVDLDRRAAGKDLSSKNLSSKKRTPPAGKRPLLQAGMSTETNPPDRAMTNGFRLCCDIRRNGVQREHIRKRPDARYCVRQDKSRDDPDPLLPLAVLAAVTVPTAARLLRAKPLLLRRLHVRHVLAELAQHAAPVYLTAKALERAVNRFVSSYFNTNSQNESPL